MRSSLIKQWLTLTLLTLVLSGCQEIKPVVRVVGEVFRRLGTAPSSTALDFTLPAHPLYVLGRDSMLAIVDAESWQVVRTVNLGLTAPWRLSRDPQGRIWIGDGASPGVQRAVQVRAADGTWLKTFILCDDPHNTITFAHGYAFVPCHETGFYAAVAVIDLASLEVIKKIEVRIAGNTFISNSSSGNDDYFIMTGGGTVANYAVLMDTHKFDLLSPVPITYGAFMEILPFEDKFLILNANPLLDTPQDERQDLITLDPAQAPTFTTDSLPAAGALWGAITGDFLYTYNNLEEIAGMDASRSISRFDLKTKTSELWPLPDRWVARDIAIVNGDILLAHSVTQESREMDGLYRFDPATGDLTLLVNVRHANRILWDEE